MTTDFTGSDSFPELINGPEPGGSVAALAVCDPVQQVASRTIWLRNRIVDRASLLEAVKDSSTFPSTGPTTLQDMKAITSWTDIAGLTLSSTSEVAEGDIVQVRALIHVRHKRATAGFLGARLTITYDVSGSPVTATANVPHWIGDGAASDVAYLPVSLSLSLPIAALASGVVTAKVQGIVTAAGDAGDDLYIANPWCMWLQILRPVIL